ncbi:M23 family metallopeptidase (plasmid) [Streptomyces sp. JL4002]|uniref:M23 family metallopeptidase n=1 Tax=Streptomyces sp. JL4002 TaxID=3404781 RepID=UPI003B27C44D
MTSILSVFLTASSTHAINLPTIPAAQHVNYAINSKSIWVIRGSLGPNFADRGPAIEGMKNTQLSNELCNSRRKVESDLAQWGRPEGLRFSDTQNRSAGEKLAREGRSSVRRKLPTVEEPITESTEHCVSAPLWEKQSEAPSDSEKLWKKTADGTYKSVDTGDIVFGRANSSVAAMQEAMISLGFRIKSGRTGYYGNETAVALGSVREAASLSLGASKREIMMAIGFTPAHWNKSSKLSSPPIIGGVVSYPYGIADKNYSAGYHTGVDFAARLGEPVLAVRSGVIERVESARAGYGKWIGLRADNGRLYLYAHLSAILVRKGESVTVGHKIGSAGSTGNSTGPHLHIEDHPAGPFVYGNGRSPDWSS